MGARSYLVAVLLAQLGVACGDSPSQEDAGNTGLPSGMNQDAGDAATGDTGGAGTGTATGVDGSGGSGLVDPNDRDACARVDARPRPKASAFWFVFDPILLDARLPTESDPLQGRTNQEMFQELLFDPGGVVPSLDKIMQFGLAHYYVVNGWSECPQGFTVPAAYDNAEALRTAFASAPQYSGTTWKSMREIEAAIDAQVEPTQNTVLLVHREGWDAVCELLADGRALQRTAIEALVAKGATVSTVAMLYHLNQASTPEQRNADMRQLAEDLATLGGGQAFATDDPEGIRQAVEASVADAVSCEITLEGEVEAGKECQGEVLLGGEAVPCNDPDGFRLLDASTLELTGAACERLREDAAATLSARFPCDVFVPLI